MRPISQAGLPGVWPAGVGSGTTIALHLPVLAQASEWVVVAKPAGLPVHRSKLVNVKDTLIRAARTQFGPQVAPVHRLDRPTSGCLLLSLDPSVTATLQAALADGDKQYLAMVRGHAATTDEVQVDTPMKDAGGVLRDATTLIRAIGRSRDPRCSLMLARPMTGRYHQVRRHCRDLNHPVLGDTKHGDTKCNRWWREHFDFPRLGLHCVSLSLDPDGLEPIRAMCPVPGDLMRIFEQMPWFDEACAILPVLRDVREA